MLPVLCVKSFGKKWEDNKSRKDRSRRKWSDFERFLPCFGAKSPYFIGFLIFAKTLVSRAFCLKIPWSKIRTGSSPVSGTSKKERSRPVSLLFSVTTCQASSRRKQTGPRHGSFLNHAAGRIQADISVFLPRCPPQRNISALFGFIECATSALFDFTKCAIFALYS